MPDRGDEVLTETSARGDGFLAGVVADWEDATGPAARAGIRTVQVRTGIVQDPRGGVLHLLHPLFAAGLGGRLGGGQQWLAWIGLDDLLDIYLQAVTDPGLSGPVNAVAPAPVRNADYTATLARVLRRPAVLPVPAFGPRLLLGAEGASEIAEASQLVHPQRLIDAGHHFRYPELDGALRHVLGREVERRPGHPDGRQPRIRADDRAEGRSLRGRDRAQDRCHWRRHQRADRRLRPVPHRSRDAVRGRPKARRSRRHPPGRARSRSTPVSSSTTSAPTRCSPGCSPSWA